MLAIYLVSNHLRSCLGDLAAAQFINDRWACSKSHNTLVPKQCIDALLGSLERFQQIDNFRTSQPLASHFTRLVACRELFSRHVERDGSWGDHTISEAGKQDTITQLRGCLVRLRTWMEGLLQCSAIDELRPCKVSSSLGACRFSAFKKNK
jgi:hypothetical protein